MVTREDLESFLIRMDVEYEEVDDGMFLARGRNEGVPIVLHYSAPLLLIRMKLMDLPAEGAGSAELYRTLLELNATDVVHGAYGIEENELILSWRRWTSTSSRRPWSRWSSRRPATWSVSAPSRVQRRRADRWGSSRSCPR